MPPKGSKQVLALPEDVKVQASIDLLGMSYHRFSTVWVPAIRQHNYSGKGKGKGNRHDPKTWEGFKTDYTGVKAIWVVDQAYPLKPSDTRSGNDSIPNILYTLWCWRNTEGKHKPAYVPKLELLPAPAAPVGVPSRHAVAYLQPQQLALVASVSIAERDRVNAEGIDNDMKTAIISLTAALLADPLLQHLDRSELSALARRFVPYVASHPSSTDVPRLIHPQTFSIPVLHAGLQAVLQKLAPNSKLSPEAFRDRINVSPEEYDQTLLSLFGSHKKLGSEVGYIMKVWGRKEDILTRYRELQGAGGWRQSSKVGRIWAAAAAVAKYAEPGSMVPIAHYAGITIDLNTRVKSRFGTIMSGVVKHAGFEREDGGVLTLMSEEGTAVTYSSADGQFVARRTPALELDTKVAYLPHAVSETALMWLFKTEGNVAAGGRVPPDDLAGAYLRAYTSHLDKARLALVKVLLFSRPKNGGGHEYLERQPATLDLITRSAFSSSGFPATNEPLSVPEVVNLDPEQEGSERADIAGRQLSAKYTHQKLQQVLTKWAQTADSLNETSNGQHVWLYSFGLVLGAFWPELDGPHHQLQRGGRPVHISVMGKWHTMMCWYEPAASAATSARGLMLELNCWQLAHSVGLSAFYKKLGITSTSPLDRREAADDAYYASLPHGLEAHVIQLGRKTSVAIRSAVKDSLGRQPDAPVDSFPSHDIVLSSQDRPKVTEMMDHIDIVVENVPKAGGVLIPRDTLRLTHQLFYTTEATDAKGRQARIQHAEGSATVRLALDPTAAWLCLELVSLGADYRRVLNSEWAIKNEKAIRSSVGGVLKFWNKHQNREVERRTLIQPGDLGDFLRSKSELDLPYQHRRPEETIFNGNLLAVRKIGLSLDPNPATSPLRLAEGNKSSKINRNNRRASHGDDENEGNGGPIASTSKELATRPLDFSGHAMVPKDPATSRYMLQDPDELAKRLQTWVPVDLPVSLPKNLQHLLDHHQELVEQRVLLSTAEDSLAAQKNRLVNAAARARDLLAELGRVRKMVEWL